MAVVPTSFPSWSSFMGGFPWVSSGDPRVSSASLDLGVAGPQPGPSRVDTLAVPPTSRGKGSSTTLTGVKTSQLASPLASMSVNDLWELYVQLYEEEERTLTRESPRAELIAAIQARQK